MNSSYHPGCHKIACHKKATFRRTGLREVAEVAARKVAARKVAARGLAVGVALLVVGWLFPVQLVGLEPQVVQPGSGNSPPTATSDASPADSGKGTQVSSADNSQPDRIIDAFLADVEASSQWDQTIKDKVRAQVEKLRAEEYTRPQAISNPLGILYPKYDRALAARDEGLDRVADQLQPFLDHDNKYLAADANFYLARMLMAEERHEQALEHLSKISSELSEYTLQAGNAVYFQGVAQAALLQNQRAVQSFEQFLSENPNAPERLRVAAWRQMEMLTAVREGSLDDVFHRMEFSRRRLDLAKTGETTQEQQDKIIDMLNKLIKEQEKKECSSSSSSSNTEKRGENPGKSQAKNPGKGRSDKGGQSNQANGVVRRTYNNGPTSPWSRLRDLSRDPANHAVKEKLPARYRQVVEKYNESVNDADDSGN